MNDFVYENVFFRWIRCYALALVFFILDGLYSLWTQVLAAAVLTCYLDRSIHVVIVFRYSQHFMLFKSGQCGVGSQGALYIFVATSLFNALLLRTQKFQRLQLSRL